MSRRLLPLAALLCAPVVLLAQGDPSINAKIIAEGKNHNHAMDTLRELTKGIGARLTGSPQLTKASNWAANKFKSYGLKNVHLEKWGDIPVGFERGRVQQGYMVAPYETALVFTTSAWSAGTNGPLKGDAVYEPKTMEEFNRDKEKLKKSWMVMRGPQSRGRRGQQSADQKPTELQTAMASVECLGRVYPSQNELVLTGGNYRDLDYNKLPKERRITIRKSDWNVITSNLDKGQRVQLMFNMQNKFIKGPMPVYNVIADLPGTDKPDEYVIVSGHLDSWNGPGSEGAIDNGTGTSVALEAARILTRVKAKPKRTIRFILWTGEEQGLLGSAAYVKAHPELLPKISTVLVDDGGTNYEGGMTGIESQKAMLEQAQAPMNGVFPDMPFNITIREHMPMGGGSDHASFNQVGVPGFFWQMVGRSDYNFVHHTQHDTYEMAIPEYMVQKSTNSAVMAYNLACADSLLPRDPNPGAGQTPRRGGG